jgi:ATP-dependent Lon protease
VHVPAGAIPKDGPSAGVTMATAIASLVTDTPINSDVAMTGEVTLTGQVLPIGGLKEKTLAAQRAGITTVILPSRNEADLEDVPEELRKGMRFVPVDRVEQVWEAAMGLKLDGKSAELAEATELLEEATELLAQARRKSRAGTAADGNGRPAEPPAAATPARRKTAAKPSAKKSAAEKKPAATRPVARKPAAKPAREAPAKSATKPAAKPKAASPKAKGGAKKTTAARGRSGRKK